MTALPSRVLIKIPGDALARPGQSAIDGSLLALLTREIADLSQSSQVACVIGAGNLWRGAEGLDAGIDRATADYMGMLGTVINSLALASALKQSGVESRVMSAMEATRVCEPYIRGKALSHLAKSRVCLFAGGSGNPFFTADLAAALRASEIEATALVRVTARARWNALREHGSQLSYAQAEKIQAFDAAALAMARERNLVMILTPLDRPGALRSALADGTDSVIIR